MKKHCFALLLSASACLLFSCAAEGGDTGAPGGGVVLTAPEGYTAPELNNTSSPILHLFGAETGKAQLLTDVYGVRFTAEEKILSISVHIGTDEADASVSAVLYKWDTDYAVTTGTAPVSDGTFYPTNESETGTLAFMQGGEPGAGEYLLLICNTPTASSDAYIYTGSPRVEASASAAPMAYKNGVTADIFPAVTVELIE